MRFQYLLISLSFLTACGAQSEVQSETDVRLAALEDTLASQDKALQILGSEHQALLAQVGSLQAEVDTLRTTEAENVEAQLLEQQALLESQAERLLAVESRVVSAETTLASNTQTLNTLDTWACLLYTSDAADE